MKKKNLVLTYSNNQTELTSLTYPFLERYCEHHNLDLLIMREQNQKILNKCTFTVNISFLAGNVP